MNKHTHVLVTLFASIIYTIVAIFTKVNTLEWGYNLILVMFFSLIFGTILKKYLDKKVLKSEESEKDETDEEIIGEEAILDIDKDKENQESEEADNYFESLADDEK